MMHKTITTSLIVCDRCGTELSRAIDEDPITARIRAAEAGWRYMRYGPRAAVIAEGPGIAKGKQKVYAPAAGDFCPECPIPREEEWAEIATKKYDAHEPPYDTWRNRLRQEHS